MDEIGCRIGRRSAFRVSRTRGTGPGQSWPEERPRPAADVVLWDAVARGKCEISGSPECWLDVLGRVVDGRAATPSKQEWVHWAGRTRLEEPPPLHAAGIVPWEVVAWGKVGRLARVLGAGWMCWAAVRWVIGKIGLGTLDQTDLPKELVQFPAGDVVLGEVLAWGKCEGLAMVSTAGYGLRSGTWRCRARCTWTRETCLNVCLNCLLLTLCCVKRWPGAHCER
jgi:hypothetical protein